MDKKITEPHRAGDEDSKDDLEFFEPKVERGKRAELRLFEDYGGIDLTINDDYFKIDTDNYFKIDTDFNLF